jgi:amino acid adenylation domain-containing protein
MSAIQEKRQALLDLMLRNEPRRVPASAPIPRRRPDEPIPLSLSQERFWFLDQLAPGNPFYVETSAVRLAMAIDAAALERAVNAVVERHEVLRTQIYVEDGRPLQRAGERVHVPLVVTDLAGRPASEQEQELERIALEQAMRPFDLTAAPLLRTALLRLGPANHIFLLAIHHIVSDGWSVSIFSREMSAYYRAFAAGRSLTLPPLPIQYFDYAAWQRETAHGHGLEEHLRYWRGQLHDLPELGLPLDHPRPRVLAFRGSHLYLSIPPNLSEGLRVLSRREQATLFMSSLAVFAAALHLYGGQTDIVVGTPVAGRNRAEIEPLIGVFLNTIVLRLDLSGNPSYRQLLRRVKRAATDAYEHQDVPFDRLVEELQPRRDLGRNPLFQVLFQFFTPPEEKSGASTTTVDAVPVDRGAAILDLAWHMFETAGGIQARIEYSTELFETGTIERLSRQFVRLLGEVIADPDRPLSELGAVLPEERERLLSAWQGPRRDWPSGESIVDLFEQRAMASPGAVALISGNLRVPYAELRERMNALALHLRERGVRRGDRVAIQLPRSIGFVASVLAVLKCGAAYVPLDPSYPAERLRSILSDSGANVVIAEEGLAGRAPEAPPVPVHPDDAAYVIYTSGSTGSPKGVIGLHGATLNRMRWMWEAFPFEAGEVACQRTAVSFVDSVWETLGPLLAGVPLVIVPDEVARDARALVRLLAAERVTRVLTVPSLLQGLLDSGIPLAAELPHLRLWFTSGERLTGELLHRFRRENPRGTLVNLYGSSEVAGDVTCDAELTELATIGRPLANCRAYVLDAGLRLVAPGVAGDLYVAGANLARGYLGQPALTAERFLPDPFGGSPGARMYATGDRARHLSDGRIEYLGRNDDQIKLRGFRIEPREVETVLREHAAVRDAAVVLQDDGAGGRLAAFVVPDGDPPAADALRAFVAARLPAHMTPGVIHWLEALPLTPNGKLDRLTLARSDAATPARAERTLPESEAETMLASIWSELLHLDEIGTNENFFDLGGHSLLAIRLVSRIRATFGVELPLQEIFLRPTVGELAVAIESMLLDEIDALSDDEVRRRLEPEWSAPDVR